MSYLHTIIQEYKVDIEGPGQVCVKTSSGETLVPTFGFNEYGSPIGRTEAKKNGCSPLKKEWISEQISEVAINYKEEHNKHILVENRPYDYLYEAKKGDRKDFNYDYINTVHVLVFSRSDRPNEIGIVADKDTMTVEDVKVSFKVGAIV